MSCARAKPQVANAARAARAEDSATELRLHLFIHRIPHRPLAAPVPRIERWNARGDGDPDFSANRMCDDQRDHCSRSIEIEFYRSPTHCLDLDQTGRDEMARARSSSAAFPSRSPPSGCLCAGSIDSFAATRTGRPISLVGRLRPVVPAPAGSFASASRHCLTGRLLRGSHLTVGSVH